MQLQTAGAVESGPPRVQVRVDLANLGDAAARGVTIEAELLGQRQLSRLGEDLPGQSGGSATFAFEVGALAPGVYPLALPGWLARVLTLVLGAVVVEATVHHDVHHAQPRIAARHLQELRSAITPP